MKKFKYQNILTKKFLFNSYIKNKKSTYKIANKINCAGATIGRYLKKFNIPRRSIGEAQQGKNNPNFGNHKLLGIKRPYVSKRMSGKNHPNFGKFGKDHPCFKGNKAVKRIKYYCIEPSCNNEISYPNWRGGKGKCASCAQTGKRSHFYIDGKSNELYPLKFNNELKEKIRLRDNHTCQKCGITEKEHLIVCGKVLSIHHIDYDKENLNGDNLITLCRNCNLKVNSNRDYWFAYFTYLMEEKNEEISKTI